MSKTATTTNTPSTYTAGTAAAIAAIIAAAEALTTSTDLTRSLAEVQDAVWVLAGRLEGIAPR